MALAMFTAAVALVMGGDLIASTTRGGVCQAMWAQVDPIAANSPATVLAAFLTTMSVLVGLLVWGYRRLVVQNDRLIKQNTDLISIISEHIPGGAKLIRELQRKDQEEANKP